MRNISTQNASSFPRKARALKSVALVATAATLALLLSACGEPAKSGSMGSSTSTGSSTSAPAPMDGASAAKP